jgi:hypothetical protein
MPWVLTRHSNIISLARRRRVFVSKEEAKTWWFSKNPLGVEYGVWLNYTPVPVYWSYGCFKKKHVLASNPQSGGQLWLKL